MTAEQVVNEIGCGAFKVLRVTQLRWEKKFNGTSSSSQAAG
jgi:hypothetical protein